MALSSQMSRTGLNRGSMGTSRKPRARRWPWLVMVVGLAGVVFAIQWLSDDGVSEGPLLEPAQAVADAPREHGAESAEVASAAVPPAETASGRAAAASTHSSSSAATASSVPSLTLGDTASGRDSAASAAGATRASDAHGTSRRPLTAEAVSAGEAGGTAAYRPDARSEADVADVLSQGMDLIAEGRLVDGRRVLSDLLFNHSERLAPVDAQAIRDTLTSVNQSLVFSPTITPGDPAVEAYRVQRGDMLSRIAQNYHTPYRLIEQINGIDARRLQAGQTIKVLRGPVHARVVKSDYRMDVYLRPTSDQPLYICSFPVGLGEADSTPLGMWMVEPGRKVQNPAWTNPRTNESFSRDDPLNPIGDYWIALKGMDPGMEVHRGYGIHGTIEPESIGTQMSMGCVRLRDADIEQIFHMLEEGQSTVEIVR